MIRHKEFVDYARTMARRHKEIRHSDKECHFLRMHLSSDPLQAHLDLNEFYNCLRSRLKPGTAMIVQSYQAGYDDNGGDHTTKECHAAIIILESVKQGAYDQLDEVYDRTERIGAEIMGKWQHDWEHYGSNPFGATMRKQDVENEKIGPVGDNMHGTRFNFSFTVPANSELTYKPDQFLDIE